MRGAAWRYQPGDRSRLSGRAGIILDENNFLRSYTNDTYLWYDEVTDRDPGLYNDPLAYFDLLKTSALTPSGTPKDQFHFTYDTEEYYQLSQSGVSYGYGITWAFISNTPPRKLLIAYTEPNSPATNIASATGTRRRNSRDRWRRCRIRR